MTGKASRNRRGRPDGRDPRPGRWQPMQRAEPVKKTQAQLDALRREFRDQGLSDEELVERLLEEFGQAEMWINDRYVVTVTRWGPESPLYQGAVQELSIRREDRRACHDWRDFQRIKTEICGPEAEAVEIYPAESRLMDTANQYYLYCLPPGQQFPAGYVGERNLRDVEDAERIGAGQRELPTDWKQVAPKTDEMPWHD